MLDLAAQAGKGGAGQLTSQSPEQAKFNLVMGYTNVALAGLDVGLEMGVMQKLAQVPGLLKSAASLTREQSLVWVASLSRIKGEITDVIAQKIAAAVKGGATEVELPEVGRIKLSELDANQPLRMQGKGPGSGEYKKP
jgi:hypothetical protein